MHRSLSPALIGALFLVLAACGSAGAQGILTPAESHGVFKGELLLAGTFKDSTLLENNHLIGRATLGLPARVDVFIEGVFLEESFLGGGALFQWLESPVKGAFFGRVLVPLGSDFDSPETNYTAAALFGHLLVSWRPRYARQRSV